MATLDVLGPYYYDMHTWIGPQGLEPGKAINFWYGAMPEFKTFSVTGHPHPGSVTGNRCALWVSDSSCERVQQGHGDIPIEEIYVYATFFNDGALPIFNFSAYVAITN
jgi:hypothetical protein